MTPHETRTPDTPRATAPPARTFGPQGPTLGELSDAYLQDYQVPAVPVPEHRPRPDRPSHRVLRPRRARRRADHLSDPPVPTRPARRRGGHRHRQPRDLGAPPHVHACRPLGLARHRARLPRPPAGESPPPGLLRAPRIPRRPPRGICYDNSRWRRPVEAPRTIRSTSPDVLRSLTRTERCIGLARSCRDWTNLTRPSVGCTRRRGRASPGNAARTRRASWSWAEKGSRSCTGHSGIAATGPAAGGVVEPCARHGST